MRLGIFGGTFDPIHLGHLILAEVCREACELDRVWFVVAGSPPHKPGGRTAIGHRLEMVRIATAGHPAFEVSEIEAHGPGPHYSFETLEAIHRDRPQDDLFFLIGADSLTDLPYWRHPDRIVERATLVVASRPPLGPSPPGPPSWTTSTPGFVPPPDRLRSIPIPLIGISSSDLRRRASEGRGLRYQVPRGVEAYIDAQGLYRAKP